MPPNYIPPAEASRQLSKLHSQKQNHSTNAIHQRLGFPEKPRSSPDQWSVDEPDQKRPKTSHGRDTPPEWATLQCTGALTVRGRTLTHHGKEPGDIVLRSDGNMMSIKIGSNKKHLFKIDKSKIRVLYTPSSPTGMIEITQKDWILVFQFKSSPSALQFMNGVGLSGDDLKSMSSSTFGEYLDQFTSITAPSSVDSAPEPISLVSDDEEIVSKDIKPAARIEWEVIEPVTGFSIGDSLVCEGLIQLINGTIQMIFDGPLKLSVIETSPPVMLQFQGSILHTFRVKSENMKAFRTGETTLAALQLFKSNSSWVFLYEKANTSNMKFMAHLGMKNDLSIGNDSFQKHLEALRAFREKNPKKPTITSLKSIIQATSIRPIKSNHETISVDCDTSPAKKTELLRNTSTLWRKDDVKPKPSIPLPSNTPLQINFGHPVSISTGSSPAIEKPKSGFAALPVHQFNTPKPAPPLQIQPKPFIKLPDPPPFQKPKPITITPKPIARNEVAIIYPAQGANLVTLHTQDIDRLKEGEFLNDSLIEFYIRWSTNTYSMKTQDSFHIFNTFFYQSLTTREDGSVGKLNIEETFGKVRSWTKKVDVFSKKFLVVPINERVHWYLAVIWNPGALLNKYRRMEEEKARKERVKDVIVVDESLPDNMIIDIATEEDNANRNSSKIGDDDCAVFIFDSLRGSHPNVGKNLMSYLLVEAKDKLQIDLSAVLPDLTLPRTYVKYAKVQDQLNYCDCGLFLLHYFTTFTRSPELVKNAIMNDQPLNTAQFGTLREIRAMRIFMKDTIEELQEKAEKYKEEMRNLNKKEC